MADECVGGLLSKFLDCSEGFVTRHMSYVFQTRKKITELKRQSEILAELIARVENEIVSRSMEGDDGQAIKTWNDCLKKVKHEADQFFLRERASNCYCFGIGCPNLGVRWQLGRKAAHITKDIDKQFIVKENYGNIRSQHPVLEVPGARNEYNPPSRTEICDHIFNLLKTSDDQFVGCYGMGGLGKTTLAMEVLRLARDASNRKFFNKAVMIQVSVSPAISKIQEQIAEVLGISLNINGEIERSIWLHNALKKMGTKFLIIFDDIWTKLDMRSVGIPCKKGELNPKILLTSRTVSALRDTGSRVNIQLYELLESEGKALFELLVGKVGNERLAEKILEKCGGHPLTISVVAGIVKHGNLDVWKDTLTQLSRFDNPEFEDKIYSVIDLSIKIVGEELKNLMLLCGILGENRIPVLNLLMYCMGLHSFKSMDTLEKARERLHTLLYGLIDRSLLVGFDVTHQCVKIHDMTRYSAARLAIETNKVFTPSSDNKLDRLPSIRNNVTTITLPHAVDEFPDTLKFPDLEFFLFHPEIHDKKGQDVGRDVPRCFTSLFAGCENLRVLSLKGISTGLPSIVNLINLRTLCLHRCNLKHSGFSDVKELKNIEVLSLRESNLTCLPREVEMLTRLKLLDLHECEDLDFIPAGLLTKLLKLEHLYMRNTVKFRWNREGSASISELESMQRLACIEINIQRGVEMPVNMNYNKLQKFYINQEIEHDDPDYYACKILLQSLPQGSSAILLQRADCIYLEKVKCQQKILFRSESFENLTKLFISLCNGMHHLFSLSMAKSLVKLKRLIIKNSDTIEEIVYIDEARDRKNTNLTVNFPKLATLSLSNLSRLRYFVNTSNISGDCQLPFFGKEVSLPELELLSINELPKLETVWGENLHHDSLSKLQKINIRNCSALVTLTRSAVLLSELKYMYLINIPKLESTWAEKLLPGSLSKLSCIGIEGCSELVTIFSSSVSLPKLQYMNLANLPKLETIWSENLQTDPLTICKLEDISIEDCSSLVTIFNSHVTTPELKLFKLAKLPKLETVWSEHLPANSLRKLHRFTVKDCSSLVTLFNTDVSLPELDDLRLYSLPKLENLWSESLQVDFLSKLNCICIHDCSSLVTLFNSDVSLPKLQYLELVKLPKCESLWRGNTQAYSPTLQDCSSLVTLFNCKVYLPELKWIMIEELPKMEIIWGGNLMEDSLCKMEYISVRDCTALVTLISSPVSLPRLVKLIMKDLPKLETVCAKQLLDDSLSKLKKLEIKDCYNLRTPFNYIDFESHLKSCQLKNLPNLDRLWVEKLVNLCQKTLKAGSVVGCGTLPHHIFNIFEQLKSITDSEEE